MSPKPKNQKSEEKGKCHKPTYHTSTSEISNPEPQDPNPTTDPAPQAYKPFPTHRKPTTLAAEPRNAARKKTEQDNLVC